MMRRFFKLIYTSFYSGAGILITARNEDNELYVLLGKRRYNPGKGEWSIPGGKKDREDSDFMSAAIRELNEEVSIGGTELLQSDHLQPVFTFFSGVFNWKTYHWHVNSESLPQVTRGRHNEFLEVQWFPINDLPKPLHWGVKAATKNAGKRARILLKENIK